jgi:hypothetical protein
MFFEMPPNFDHAKPKPNHSYWPKLEGKAYQRVLHIGKGILKKHILFYNKLLNELTQAKTCTIVCINTLGATRRACTCKSKASHKPEGFIVLRWVGQHAAEAKEHKAAQS